MTTDPVGGVWTYALDLARELVRGGHQVVLASMGGRVAADQHAAAEAAGVRLEVNACRLEWMDEPWDDVDRAGDWLLGLEAECQPDVVHVNGFSHGATAFRAPRMVVAHSCVVSWWWAVFDEGPPARYTEYRRRVRAGLEAADAVVAPTRFMLDAVRRHYGPLRKERVIANGRASDRFQPRVKWPYIASAGRLWDRAKNIETLVAAAAGLPWPVFVAGEGTPPRSPPGSASRAGLRFVGRLEEPRMCELLGRAAVYVHPARYEPFGLTVLEAASAGCALVLSGISSLRENWTDAAIFVDPDAPDDIGEAVRRLARHPSDCAALAARARSRARSFSSRRMAEEYESEYRDLAARRSD